MMAVDRALASIMADEANQDPPLEIAHLLLIDLVGYSRLLVNDQIKQLKELNRVVRDSACFQAAEKEDKLIRLPTGDGMALLFFRSPEEPVRCALEIAEALKTHPEIQLRMGIHSGPINQVPDVNDRSNVAGAGINVAQRVMDCGDAGHILLSSHVADDLAQYEHWRAQLHDLGDCEVKHGLRLRISNLYTSELGNSRVPAKLRRGPQWRKNPRVNIRPVAAPGTPPFAIMAALVLALLAVLALCLFLLRHETKSPPETTTVIPMDHGIAVLPLENLTVGTENSFFADGIHDEILTDLSKVADLKVISRTSVMQYKNPGNQNIREVAKQLGVAHIVEGTVQVTGSQVRVSVQLIDARNDTHIWAEHFVRNLSDIFQLESELAETIVAQLETHLSPNEKAAIEEQPTADMVAYRYYVSAKLLIDNAVFGPGSDNLFEAVRLLQLAVQHDPSFFLAYYQLAHADDQIYRRGFDHSEERLAAANAAIQTMRRLRPDSGEAHLALAKHLYWGYLDYDRALAELISARRFLPNDPWLLILEGYINRRQGHWDDSMVNLQRAHGVDPRNILILQQLALSYQCLRQFDHMRAALDQALAIAPDDVALTIQRAAIDLDWHANPQPLRAAIDRTVAASPAAARQVADQWVYVAFCQRDVAAAEKALSFLPNDGCANEGIPFPKSVCEAEVAKLHGDSQGAQTAFIKAREEVEPLVRQNPEYAKGLCALGFIDAALGRRDEALLEGRKALQLLPPEKDAVDGPLLVQYMAFIYAYTGDKDRALQQLEIAAKLPGYLSYGVLRLYPYWDPLRNDPRFQKIVDSLAPKS